MGRRRIVAGLLAAAAAFSAALAPCAVFAQEQVQEVEVPELEEGKIGRASCRDRVWLKV